MITDPIINPKNINPNVNPIIPNPNSSLFELFTRELIKTPQLDPNDASIEPA